MNSAEDIVVGVHLFPIKGCREATIGGLPPLDLEVGETGFEHNGVVDRGLVIADEADLFVSQRGWDRNHSRKYATDALLATVSVEMLADHLRIRSADHGSANIPIDLDRTASRPIKIFGPELMAYDAGDEGATFFSDLLGRSLRLVKADRSHPRMLGAAYQRPGAVNQSAGADARPFSLASMASLDHLHELVGMEHGTVPLNRYRANIEISGLALGPFGEDEVKLWKIGPMTAFGVKALPRCPVPNIDQRTGSDEGRLSTKLLSKTRMGWPAYDLEERPEPMFGQSLNHVVPDPEDRTIRVNSPVLALETGQTNVVLKGSMLR